MTPFFCRRLRLSLSVPGALIIFTLAFALAACGGSDESASDKDRLQVVTTLPLFADFVRQIGGDGVEVTSLLPAGSDPHTWEPSPGDVEKVVNADIAFVHGLGLDAAAASVIETNLPSTGSLVVLGEAVTTLGSVDPSGAEEDPHMWLDPALAALYVVAIRDELSEVDVDSQENYSANEEAYGGELGDLESYIRDKVADIPPGRRKLVTAHEAFTHMARYLDFEVLEVVAHSPGQEPGPDDVADIARAIEDEELVAVFGEPQIEEEGRILQQAAEDAGVEFCTLYSDSLDDRVTSYIELMRFNANELARCLGGE